METSTSMGRSMARWIIETRRAQLEARVLEKAQTCLRDMIGVARLLGR
jgi:hypothetical protein